MKIAKCIKLLDMEAMLDMDDLNSLQRGEHQNDTLPLPGGKLVLGAMVARWASDVSRYHVTLSLYQRGVETMTHSGRKMPCLFPIAEGQSDRGGWSSLPPAIKEAQADLVTNVRSALERAVVLADVAGADFGVEDEEEGT